MAIAAIHSFTSNIDYLNVVQENILMRTGIAHLPLHYGKAPKWLFARMEKLSLEISRVIIEEFSQKEFLKRISNPYWFQAFGCILGFDWHSSGLTTTTCAALKSINRFDLGVKVCGGKGKNSIKTLMEIENSDLNQKKIEKLKKASRLSAKVDNSCVQDNYNLYHHTFIFTSKGDWCVIQQGLNSENKYARRYHWLSFNVDDFINEPHNGIIGFREKNVLNLTSKENKELRKSILDIVNDGILIKNYQTTLNEFKKSCKILKMPERHEITYSDLDERSKELFKKIYEFQPENFEELLLFRGIGFKRLRSLSLISNLIYGSEISWKDPVKYSFAHGGKDGYPYKVNKKIYDESIKTLKEAIEMAEIGRREKLNALKKLNQIFNS